MGDVVPNQLREAGQHHPHATAPVSYRPLRERERTVLNLKASSLPILLSVHLGVALGVLLGHG